MPTDSSFSLSTLRKTFLSSKIATEAWTGENFTSLSTTNDLSNKIASNLSNVINTKLSTIADAVSAEVQHVDAISAALSNYSLTSHTHTGYATQNDISTAIQTLDGVVTGSAGAGKTLTSFSQTDGKVTAGFGDILITKSQISDFPTIPTVNNGTLTIQKNGTLVQTFSANQSNSVTANISVPTKTSDLTNDSGFVTSSDLTKVMEYQGTKTTYAELPSSGNKQGDVWNVVSAYNDNPPGTNYAWSGTSWDPLGGTIDVSVFATKAELNDLSNEVLDGLSNDVLPKLSTIGDLTIEQTQKINAISSDLSNYALTSQIPTVNNGTLTIQKNGTNVQTFTANQSNSVTANISVPLSTSQLTNDSGFITSSYVSLSAIEKSGNVIVLTESQKTALVQSSEMPAEAWGDFTVRIDESGNFGYIGNIDCYSVSQDSNGNWIYTGGMTELNVLGWVPNSTVIQGADEIHTVLSVGTTSADLALRSDVEKMLPLDGGGEITGGFGVVDLEGKNLFSVNNYGKVSIGYDANSSSSGIAIGYQTSAYLKSIAIGYHTSAVNNYGAVAIGEWANATAREAIQLGWGTNSSEDTLQFKSYPLVDSNGNIPEARVSAIGYIKGIDVSLSDYLPLSGGTVPYSFGLKFQDGTNFLCAYNSHDIAAGGVAIGNSASIGNTGATAVGDGCVALNQNAVAIGMDSQANYGIAIGGMAVANPVDSIAFGTDSYANAISSIQFGRGINATQKSLQVWEYPLLLSTGDIPAERLSANSPQSDWTQTLTSAADYIKNKPTSFTPSSHRSTATTYGVGTGTYYGHVKLSDALTATSNASSEGTAATPYAVNQAILSAKNYTDSAISQIPTGDYVPLSGGEVSSNFALKVKDGSQTYNVLSGVGYSGNLAFGYSSSATGAGANALGTGAVAKGHESLAIGNGSQIQNEYNVDGVAIGYNAIVNTGSSYADGDHAIQLGYGTNITPHTFQVFNYTLMDTATGDIPYARISAELSNYNYTETDPIFSAWVNGDSISAGNGLSVNSGIAIGSKSNGGNGVAIGTNASVGMSTGTGVAIGISATSTGRVPNTASTAVGRQANAAQNYSMALGTKSVANALSAIQLGMGTNSTAGSLQVWDYQLLDKDGNVPYARVSASLSSCASNESLNQLSSEMVDGLSNVVLPKLDSISALVTEEVDKVDAISSEIGNILLVLQQINGTT